MASYRRRLWRWGKVKTEAQFKTFLDQLGLCLIFGSDEIPLPKVYDVAHDDAEGWWNWKDHLQAKRQAYMGRLLQGKATLVSMELLPAFLRLYVAGGGCASYDEEHYYGRLSQEAKWICDQLDQMGPSPADALRKAVRQDYGLSTAIFHKALLELQRKFKVVTTGLIDKGWGTRVVGLFEEWLPSRVDRQAQRLSPEKARELILKAILRAAGCVPLPILPRLLGWPEGELNQALQALLERRFARQVAWPRSTYRTWLVFS